MKEFIIESNIITNIQEEDKSEKSETENDTDNQEDPEAKEKSEKDSTFEKGFLDKNRAERKKMAAEIQSQVQRERDEIEKQADNLEKLCDELGMNLTTAFTIFAKKMVREQGIPFRINKESYEYEEPNEETIAAFEEGERMLRDPNTKKYRKDH